MTKSFLTIVAIALLGGVPFAGQAPMPAMAGDATCRHCCPHCGCRLVPECHIECTIKKETTYKYTCNCDSICVPGVTRCCDKGDGKEDCRRRIHDVRHLVKIPCVKEVPIHKCTVEWVCPHCDRAQGSPSSTPPSAPSPSASPAAGKTAANSLPDESTGATIPSDPRS
jgi:hypothetical protein